MHGLSRTQPCRLCRKVEGTTVNPALPECARLTFVSLDPSTLGGHRKAPAPSLVGLLPAAAVAALAASGMVACIVRRRPRQVGGNAGKESQALLGRQGRSGAAAVWCSRLLAGLSGNWQHSRQHRIAAQLGAALNQRYAVQLQPLEADSVELAHCLGSDGRAAEGALLPGSGGREGPGSSSRSSRGTWGSATASVPSWQWLLSTSSLQLLRDELQASVGHSRGGMVPG